MLQAVREGHLQTCFGLRGEKGCFLTRQRRTGPDRRQNSVRNQANYTRRLNRLDESAKDCTKAKWRAAIGSTWASHPSTAFSIVLNNATRFPWPANTALTYALKKSSKSAFI